MQKLSGGEESDRSVRRMADHFEVVKTALRQAL